MEENLANFSPQPKPEAEIKVIGVGGGGGNAVNHMYCRGIRDVDFVICNTDAQAMDSSPVQTRVQLGASLTEGRGAGNKPEVGKEAALENITDVKDVLANNTKMVFITAGMGGGTGTGGAPVIAQACREAGYLTVAIVTIPFRNEGRRRIRQAVEGITELENYVDSLLVINNERIREMYGDFGISEAFSKADDVLSTAARGIAEIITVPGYVNVDFADVETVMRDSGCAVMGTGMSTGPERAREAVEHALNSPLLSNSDIRGAKNVLLHITSGNQEVTMDEVGQITDFVQNRAGFDADLIWGNSKDDSLDEQLSVTLVATGFSMNAIPGLRNNGNQDVEKHRLNDSKTTSDDNNKKYIQDKKKTKKGTQRYIEFSVDPGESEEDHEFEALYPKTMKERSGSTRKKTIHDLDEMTDDDIDDLENIPAYQRRQIRMNDPGYKKKMSKLSVSSDNKISDKNSYLFDQVD